MTASISNPKYSISIITSDRKYDVTNALISLNLSEQEKQISCAATIDLFDVDVGGDKLSSLIAPSNRVSIYANDGETDDAVFDGYLWALTPKESLTDSSFSIKCYDQLIYWQESEDSYFFSAGKESKNILETIAKGWGINLEYTYSSITHEKVVLRGTIADFVTADILDAVQKRKGSKYVIRSEHEKVVIQHVGSNNKIYIIADGKNTIEIKKYITLNGVTTQVIILGTADDDGKSPIEATITGKTNEYGTIQKIISKSEDTALSDAEEEAQNILDESGEPKWEYDIKAVDIPWIRKGDRVKLDTSTLKGLFIVKSVDRDISNSGNVMNLTVTEE